MKRLALAATLAATLLALPAFAASVGSLARVSVIDRTTNRELPVYWKDGRAWVAGQPGNEYRIRVRNAAGEDLLAVVSVDGVNVVTGQSASTEQSGYVVGSYASLDVTGWRKNMQRTAAFYFTSLPDSYAARTGRPDDVGVIGVALFRRKPAEPYAYDPFWAKPFAKQESGRSRAESAVPPGAAPSERFDSAESSGKRAQAESPLGTGHGRRETNHARWTQFERATPYAEETIAIYYDSRRNLVAQGVIHEAPHYGEARPFPGFVPDPVSYYRQWHRPPGS